MPEPLARIENYSQLVDALRERAAALNLSFENLDALAGLHDGYSSHLLPPHPQSSMRTLGKTSLGCVLGALGTELLLTDRISRLGRRDLAQVRNGTNGKPFGILRKSLRASYFAALGRRGGRARFNAMSQAEKSRLGKIGARARWRRTAEAK
jgi:hypothetical protein